MFRQRSLTSERSAVLAMGSVEDKVRGSCGGRICRRWRWFCWLLQPCVAPLASQLSTLQLLALQPSVLQLLVLKLPRLEPLFPSKLEL